MFQGMKASRTDRLVALRGLNYSRKSITSGRHGPNGLNGKQMRVTHYVPRRALPCRPLVMGYSQLLSIKTIRVVPCRDVPAARNGFPAYCTELHALYSSPNIIRNLKSRRLR